MNETDTNEWIDWIQEAIDKGDFTYYEYKHFSNIQEIGSGAFAKVFRANWKNSDSEHLALKSFFDFNGTTVREIVREVIIKYDTTLKIFTICSLYILFPYLILYLCNLAQTSKRFKVS